MRIDITPSLPHCSAGREGGWDVAAQAAASPEHPPPTGSVAIPLIAQASQRDLGAPPEFVGLYEVVQSLSGPAGPWAPYAEACTPLGRD